MESDHRAREAALETKVTLREVLDVASALDYPPGLMFWLEARVQAALQVKPDLSQPLESAAPWENDPWL